MPSTDIARQMEGDSCCLRGIKVITKEAPEVECRRRIQTIISPPCAALHSGDSHARIQVTCVHVRACRIRQRAFFSFGMDVLLSLDLTETRQFFAAFFALSDHHWQVSTPALTTFFQRISSRSCHGLCTFCVTLELYLGQEPQFFPLT